MLKLTLPTAFATKLKYPGGTCEGIFILKYEFISFTIYDIKEPNLLLDCIILSKLKSKN